MTPSSDISPRAGSRASSSASAHVCSGVRIADYSMYSSVDWPGKLAAVVFMDGCMWRCDYCHNREMSPVQDVNEDRFFAELASRRGFLDGVVISGGEPLLQKGLAAFIGRIRALGFEAGLHTTGFNTESFLAVLPYCDWVGFDVKAPLKLYPQITCVSADSLEVDASLRALITSGVKYELRTTVDEGVLRIQDLCEMERYLRGAGASSWILQTCNTVTEKGAITARTASHLLISEYLSHAQSTIARLR